MANNQKINGYDVKELIAVAEMMKKCNINPDQLHHVVETFKRGYEMGQRELYKLLEENKQTLLFNLNGIIKG